MQMKLLSALGIGRNATEADIEEMSFSKCGVNFCPSSLENTKSTLENFTDDTSGVEEENFKTTRTQIYVLAGIYLFCSLAAPLILAVFLDPLNM